MTHTPNELHEEFPQCADRIHALKESDRAFAALAEAYHELNRTIHRGETLVEPMADEALEDLKRKRLTMKDEVAARLAAA